MGMRAGARSTGATAGRAAGPYDEFFMNAGINVCKSLNVDPVDKVGKLKDTAIEHELKKVLPKVEYEAMLRRINHPEAPPAQHIKARKAAAAAGDAPGPVIDESTMTSGTNSSLNTGTVGSASASGAAASQMGMGHDPKREKLSISDALAFDPDADDDMEDEEWDEACDLQEYCQDLLLHIDQDTLEHIEANCRKRGVKDSVQKVTEFANFYKVMFFRITRVK